MSASKSPPSPRRFARATSSIAGLTSTPTHCRPAASTTCPQSPLPAPRSRMGPLGPGSPRLRFSPGRRGSAASASPAAAARSSRARSASRVWTATVCGSAEYRWASARS